MNKTTAVFYFKTDAKQFLIDKPEVNQIYPLTPDAYATIKDKTSLPIVDPEKIFTDYSHRKIIARMRCVEKIILPILYKEKKLSIASKETFRGLFHLLTSAVYYIHFNIKSLGPWLIFDGKNWIKYDSLHRFEKVLIEVILTKQKNNFNIALNNKLKFPTIISYYNNLLMKFLLNKSMICFTGDDYQIPSIKKDIKINDNNIWMLNFTNPSLISFFKGVAKTLLKSKEVYLTQIPSYPKEQTIIINSLLSHITDPVILNAGPIIFDHLNVAVSYTQSIKDYSKTVFSRLNVKTLIAHQLRWLDGAVFGEAAKINNIPSILISHGSHPLQTNLTSGFEHKETARGLLFSPLASETVVQSSGAEKACEDYMPKLKRWKYQPIMWGGNRVNHIMKKRPQIRTILHAGTYKALGSRPWIYETSNEFIKGLRQLVIAVSKLQNTQLIIRIRSNSECSIDSLRKLLPPSDNCLIKTSGQFLDDLSIADLLISFSSTAIEEAIYNRKPVGLFGGSDRYRHLIGSSTLPSKKYRSTVYHLQNNNLSEMLNAILDAHNTPLNDKELELYTWPFTIPGRTEFISRILN